MPTISGLRRRGYTPEAIRNFCDTIGVAKSEQRGRYCHCWSTASGEDLNQTRPRVMAVLHPLKVVIDNYPEDQVEELEAVNNPEDASMGTRKVPFSRVLYIEQDDFMEDPPKKFFRLAPGREVRLRYALLHHLHRRGQGRRTGKIVELRCTYDPATRGGDAPDGRKVKATLHWVSAHARARGRGAPVRPAVPDRESGRCARRRRTSPITSTRTRWKSLPTAKSSRVSLGHVAGRAATSSSAWATSASIRTRRRTSWSSTAPSALRDTWAKIQQQNA